MGPLYKTSSHIILSIGEDVGNYYFKQEVQGRINCLLSFHYILGISYAKDCTENSASNSSIVACIFVVVGTCLPNPYLATAGDLLSLLLFFQNKKSRLKV
jgi:hypothetical protein